MVSVLKGEGTVPILFGTTNISLGAKSHIGYLARPDLAGEWPTVVMVPGGRGATSAMRDVARRLARHGVAVVVPDVYRGDTAPPDISNDDANRALDQVPLLRGTRDVNHVASFVANRASVWSSAGDGFGVIVHGAGSRFGGPLASSEGVAAIALVGAFLVDEYAAAQVPLLALYGKDDEFVSPEDIKQFRANAPQTEVVLYGDVGSEFLDDDLDGHDYLTAKDAIERMAEFFIEHLPSTATPS